MSVGRKKVFEVIKATKDPITAIDVDGEVMKFGKHDAFVVHDEGKARFIEETYEKHGDVVVCEVDSAGKQHARRVFSINAPWKGKDGNNSG